jgi:hypothetical protein
MDISAEDIERAIKEGKIHLSPKSIDPRYQDLDKLSAAIFRDMDRTDWKEETMKCHEDPHYFALFHRDQVFTQIHLICALSSVVFLWTTAAAFVSREPTSLIWCANMLGVIFSLMMLLLLQGFFLTTLDVLSNPQCDRNLNYALWTWQCNATASAVGMVQSFRGSGEFWPIQIIFLMTSVFQIQRATLLWNCPFPF